MSEYPLVTELVPHGAPMLALDELIEWSEGYSRGRLVIGKGSYFQQDGHVDSVVTFEYMAQTVAACLGMESRSCGDGSVRVGMVIACRSMTIDQPSVAVGEELFTEAKRVRGSDYSSQFATEIRNAAGERIAAAMLTLVHGESPPE